MSLDYDLIIDGIIDPRIIAERLSLDFNGRQKLVESKISADLFATRGWSITIASCEGYYVDANTGQAPWEWELGPCVLVNFELDTLQLELASVSAARAVARILATGPEDCAFVQNGDWLLLTRFSGKLCKYQREGWWESYVGLNEMIPD